MGISPAGLNPVPKAPFMIRAPLAGSTPGQVDPREDKSDLQPLSELMVSEQ